MNFSQLFTAALIAGLALSSSANATNVDLTRPTYSLGEIEAGPAVNFTAPTINANGNNLEYGRVSGSLAADTKVVFTYTISGNTNNSGKLFAYSPYDSGLTASSNGQGNSTAYAPLVTLLANLSTPETGPKVGTATIKNSSSSAIKFIVYFLSNQASLNIKTSYVASAPLPPAVILFASGLLSLVGFASYRKRRNPI